MSRRVAGAIALAVLLVLAGASGSRGQDRPLVADDLHRNAWQQGGIRVLVQLDTPYVPEAHLPSAAHVQAQRHAISGAQGLVRSGLRAIPHRVVRDFQGAVPLLAIEIGPEGLRMLESLRGVVTSVVEDRPRRPSLVESVPRIQADQAAAFGYDGAGAVIAILDTGVDESHPFFQNGSGASRIVHEACFSSNSAGGLSLCPNGQEQDLGPGAGDACAASIDGCDHGTLVAGIAAGRGTSFNGVAPGAGIVSIQVFSMFNDTAFCGGPAFTPCVGSFPSDELAAGLYLRDTLLAAPQSLNIAAVNLSLGSGAFPVPCDANFPGETTLITDLRARGVATVVASGNDGLNGSLTAPACIGAAISVGATTDPPGEAIAAFSNRATGMSLLAPGVSITTATPGSDFATVDGTSMAAPHVAGVFAIFKQAVPSATVAQVLSALQTTGQSIGGFKRVRVFDALATFANVVPTVQFSSATYSTTEGDTNHTATVTVTRSGPAAALAAGTTTVLVSTSPGTATAGTSGSADYVALSNQVVTFGPGETAKSVSITIRGDFTVEPNETVVLTLSGPTGAVLGTSTAVLTIVNDDVAGTVAFDQPSSSVTEGAGPATLTLRRTGGLAAGTVAFVSTITGGTATSGSDYTAFTNRAVTFAAGSATATFTVTIADDSTVEPNETVNVRIASVSSGASIGTPSTAVLTIVSNDVSGAVQFSAATYTVTEATPTATITVVRTGTAAGPTVNYRVTPGSPGSATGGGGDYTLASGTLTFGAGESSRTFTLAIVDDNLIEPDETVNLELLNPSAGFALGAQTTAVLTIRDNDAPTFSFAAATYSVAEGAAASVAVARANGLGTAVTVGYQVQAASTATGGGQDYTLANGTLTFGVGSTAQMLAIPTTEDTLAEGGETIVIRLVNPSAGTVVAPDTTTVTITDDDNPGTIQFSAAAYSVVESGGPALVRVTRTGTSLASGVTVQLTTGNGTATAGADYTSATQVLTFGAGDTFKDVAVTIMEDSASEGNETVLLALSNPTAGAALGAPVSAVLTILDDEQSLELDASTYTVTEGGVATITVVRVGPPLGTVMVDYATAAGTATAGADYTSVTGTLTFAPGLTSQTFTVSTVSDTLFEPTETATLRLSNPTGSASLGPQSTATLSIVDNDPAGSVRFSAAAYTVSEAAGPATLTVQRTQGTASAVTVDYATAAGGTAVAGADYVATAGTLTFGAGETSKTFTVTVVNDTGFQADRTVNLVLAGVGGGATLGSPSAAVLTITNDDNGGTIQFGAAAYSVVESAGPAIVRVTRTGTSLASGVTVQLTTTNGTATAAADYTNSTQVLTFGAGETFKDVAIPALDDALSEGNETVMLALSSPSAGAVLGAVTSAVLTILDDEQSLELSAATYTVTEGGTATITVTRTGPALGTVTVDYATAAGTAAAGADYTSATGTLTFVPGLTSQTFTVSTVNDTIFEPTETVTLRLSNPTGSASLGGQSTATLSIVDNDPAGSLRFSAATYSASETAGSVTITVQRTQGTASAVTVDYATVAGGTAVAGTDYVTATGTLTFGATDTTKTFTIDVVNDTRVQPDRTVNLALSNVGGGATLGSPSAAVLTITSDDSPGTIQFSAAAYSVVESGGPALVRVTRTGTSLASGVTVQLTTSNGTATAGTDYTSATQVLTFGAGEAFKDVAIGILGDSASEGNETVLLALGNPTAGAALGATVSAVLTILDDEQSLDFSAATYTVTEAATTVTVTVTRTGPPLGTVTVDYATTPGSATPGLDYTSVAGTLTFAPGVLSQTFGVPILSDTLFEPTETVTLRLSNPTGSASLGPQSTATLSIVDNDPAGSVRFSAAAYTASEAAGQATITVQRTQGTASAVTVDYATVGGGSAVAGADYLATSGTLTFNANDTSKTFTVTVMNDTAYQADRTVSLALANPTGGAALTSPAAAVLTIRNDDTPGTIQFSATAYSVAESAGPAVIRVTRTGGNLAGGVTVQFSTGNGTATAGLDYVNATQVLTFGPGETFRDVTIGILSDTASEGNETVTLTLGNPSPGAVLGATQTAVLTILDDEQSVQFSAPAYTVTEAATTVTITVTRTGPPLGTVTVDYTTVPGTATPGLDYTSVAGTLTFAPGVLSRTFGVPILGDTIFEPTETVTLRLGNASGSASVGTQSTATLSIVDNDPPGSLRFGAATYTVAEAAGTATITVQRTQGTASAVTVDYATVAGGSAVTGTDYVATSGTLTFNANDTSKTFTVTIHNDALYEADRTVNLALTNPTGGATLTSPATAVLTITNDDTAGTIQLGAATYSVVESAGPAVVRVTRTGSSLAAGVTVQLTSADGTATAGVDYASATRVLTFAAGEAFKDVPVTILDDAGPEGNETVTLTLSSPSAGAMLGTTRTAVLTILDDEQSLQFSAPVYTVSEGTAPLTLTVLRIGPAFGIVTVDYTTGAGSAAAGVDYTLASGTLTFAPGVTSKTFTIPMLADTLFEPMESMTVRLANPTGSASLGPQSTATVNIMDNDPAGSIRFSAATYTASEAAGTATITVQRTQGTASAVTVDYATVGGGSATAGSDYVATAGTLTFNANETSKTFTVAVLNDTVDGSDVTVTLALSNPTGGATLGSPSTAVLTITDEDTPGTIQLSATAYSVIENVGPAIVRVTRTGASLASGVTVQLTTTNGTATAGVDYADATQVLTFAAGEAFKDIPVATIGDSQAEGNETVLLTLGNASAGAVLGANRTAVLTILDDEQSMQFSAPVYVVTETAAPVTITVTRTGPALGTVTVDYATAAGSAIAARDYLDASGTLTFPPGVASRTFTVPMLDDTVFEDTKSIALVLTNPTGSALLGPQRTATITLIDNDPPGAIRFSAAAYSTPETAAAAITVTRTGTASAVTVDYATVAGGTATAGADYLTTSGTLTFAAGEASKTFVVPILNDARDEPNETVTLTLANPTGGATLGTPSTAVLTITDEDVPGPITLSAASYTASETAGLALITVRRTGGASGVTVDFTTADGSATAPADYTAVSQRLSFGVGETSKLVAIPIVDDLLREGNETIRLILSNATGGATLGAPAEAVLTLTDNEIGPTVQFSAAAYSVAENVAGGVFNVTLTRTGASTPGQTVRLSASAGSAIGGSDFVAVSNQLVTFPGTQASVTVPITILDNPAIVGSRTVDLRLSGPGGGLNLGVPRAATLTILEDDGTVQFASATHTVTEGLAVVLTVTRSGGTVGTATVDYATSAGSAAAGADYTTKTGSLVFGPGVTSQTITVATLADILVEGPETFTVTLANPGPAGSTTLGAPSTTTVTITDDDAFGVLKLASPSYTVTEGGTATLTVTRSGGSAGTVTVQYATSNGGGGGSPAIGGAAPATGVDYTTMAGTLTFLNGVVSQTIVVPTRADTLLEGPETLTVTLSGVTGGAALGAPASAVVTIADDETPRLQLAAPAYTVAESAGSVTLTVQRVGPTTGENTVQYALAGVTATGGGVDFTGAGGVLTFGPGIGSRTIVVPITNDAVNEPVETFTVTLANPTGGAILGTPVVATVTITDNDPAGIVQFSQAGYAVVEGGLATITVTRTGSAGPVTVDFATSDGSASGLSDYTGTAGRLTFQPGETSRTFSVATTADGAVEGSESLVVTLSNPTGGLALGAQSTATLWIVDAAQSVQFGAAGYSVIEGGTVLVTVTRSGVPSGTVTVGFQIAAGSTALETADFSLTPSAGTLTFAPGVSSQTITVKTVNDLVIEGPESVILQLTGPAGAILGTPASVQVTVIDNERPDLVIGSLAGPTQAATGVPMPVVITVRNQTGGQAPATTLGVYVSAFSTLPGAGTRIGLVTIPALAGGATHTATASLVVPAGLAPGNYFLSAIADNAAVAIEESEANNGLTAPAQIDIVSFQ